MQKMAQLDQKVKGLPSTFWSILANVKKMVKKDQKVKGNVNLYLLVDNAKNCQNRPKRKDNPLTFLLTLANVKKWSKSTTK